MTSAVEHQLSEQAQELYSRRAVLIYFGWQYPLPQRNPPVAITDNRYRRDRDSQMCFSMFALGLSYVLYLFPVPFA